LGEKRKNICEIQTAEMILLISVKWCDDVSEWTGLAKDRHKKWRALVNTKFGFP